MAAPDFLRQKTVLKNDRLRSLDVFRGMTIAAMIVVNSPGNDTGYACLRHAPWNGWTFTDLIFPFFLLIMGAAIPFSFSKYREQNNAPNSPLWKIFRRSVVLFVLGLPGGISLDPDGLFRIPGVLQRIAVCYGTSATLYLKTRLKTQLAVAALLLVGYWLLLTQVPVPVHGKGELTIEGNLASYLDRLIFGRHLYTDLHDPEGLLSTLPAIAASLIGILAGVWLRADTTPRRKALGMLGVGIALTLAGQAWNIWFPINKQIWTSSFALFSSGIGLCALSFCYWLIDIQGYGAWGKPFEVFGVNSIASYCLASLGYALLELWKIPRLPGQPQTFRMFYCYRLFGRWLPPEAASAAYAVTYMLLWWVVMSLLHKKKIHIKI